jgi:hypothetical protein
MSDCVQICGMKDADGKALYFEEEAYHLVSWCVENGLKHACEDGEYEISID